MNTSTPRRLFRLVAFLGAGLLSLLSGAPLALADDTEVYVSGGGGTNSANIMFIIDTSGSMSTTVTIPAVYDPGTTYSGSCNAARLYWSAGTTPPSCSTTQWTPTTQNFCDASVAPLSSGGRFTDQVAMWRGNWSTGFFGFGAGESSTGKRWQTLQAQLNNHAIECQDDAGVHGSTAGTWYADKTARDSAPKWTATAANQYAYTTVYTLYTANYLNWYAQTNSGTTMNVTRLWMVQDVTKKLVDRLNGVNIGLMRFDASSGSGGYQGGGVMQPVGDITTNRAAFKTALASYTAAGNTPLEETYYEAYLYMTGGTILYGNTASPPSVASSKDSSNTAKYKSPITDSCQKNYIVYLTDGDPTEDTSAHTPIYNLLGTHPKGNCTATSTTDGICIDELAGYMNDYLDAAPSLSGNQNIITYTVGFFSDTSLLSDMAVKGGGKYYTVTDYAGLDASLTGVFTEILSQEGSFTAPAVSVNAFSRLNHRDEIYFALFSPQITETWPGNIKRYRYNATYDNGTGATPGAIVDSAGLSAIDPNTGGFRSGAQSWWTTGLDGDSVAKGGAANMLGTTRNMYTYTASAAPNNADLTTAANKLHESNVTTLTPLLAIQSPDIDATSLIQWARGLDMADIDGDGITTTEARKQMGDPLHTRPVLVTYGGTDTAPDLTLYAMTNEGLLHAIDPDDGTEVFSFMPKELLSGIEERFLNQAGTDHLYGLDGPLVARVKNTGSTTLQTSEGDLAYLYLGMRRGGRNYYALDVTTRTAPKLKWMISGGGSSGNFAELGQSWSAPSIGQMNIGGTVKNVMIFAGGYDPNHDTKTTRSNDSQGRSIYIVDADTGALLWSGGTADTGASASHESFTKTFTDMHYAIASDVNAFDINGDGLVDQMYVGDLGGQLWRFDVANGQSASSLVTGGVILDVGGTTAATNRRFHYAPSVALEKQSGVPYLALAIGTGWREHPLDTVVDDRFYTIKQTAVYSPPKNTSGVITYTKLTESDLYDVTADLIQQGDTTQQATATTGLAAKQGWYIQLEGDGEKALAQAEIFNDQIVFSTYTPAVSTTTCGGAVGAGASYLVSIFDGSAVENLSTTAGDATSDAACSTSGVSCDKADRKRGLKRGGIPPGAVILFPAGHDPVILIGPETPFTANFGQLTQRTFWRDVPN
ncbi:MAG: PilC/PilY family type IV pilus protein [Pseudomonadota bacterium]